MFPGRLCSFGKGKLLQLSIVEPKTGFLKGLWREKCSMRLQSEIKYQQVAKNPANYMVFIKRSIHLFKVTIS